MLIYRGPNSKDEIEFILRFVHKRLCIDYAKTEDEYIKQFKKLIDVILCYSNVLFIVLEEEKQYRIITTHISTTDFDLDVTCQSLPETIFELYQLALDDTYCNVSKSDIENINEQIAALIQDAIFLYNISIDLKDENVDNLIEEIVKEMLKITRFYKTFESHSIDVKCNLTGLSTENKKQIKIRFYNGGEEKYNPRFEVTFKMSKNLFKEAIKDITNKDSIYYTEDCSCGLYVLLRDIILATIDELNKNLNKLGFNNILYVTTDNIMNMTYLPKIHIKEAARICTLRGIIEYLKKYDKWDADKYNTKWQWLLTDNLS